MPPKSKVWQYFEQTKAEDGCKAAICRLCVENPPTLRCSDNSTSTLWSHLAKLHREDHEKIKKKTDPLHGVKKDGAGGSVFRQRTIGEIFGNKAPYGRSHSKQKNFDRNFKNQIVNDFIPFRMADSKFFRKTVTELDPRIRVKSARTYSRQIRSKEKVVKKKIKKLVRKNATNFLTLTSDMWDDGKQNSYCSLTTHFISSVDFKLVRVTPAIRYFGTERHQSVNISKLLSEEIDAVRVDQDVPVVLVTDGTANMVKTREILSDNNHIDLGMDCSIHKLQNAVKDTDKESKGMARSVLKCKKMIKFFRKPTLASNRFKTACAKAGHKHKKIRKWIDIRWNTQHDSLKRLLYHQECIEDMDRSRYLDKVNKYIPSREEWRILQEAVEILEPVKSATKVLESETEPTLNRLAEVLYDISEGLKVKSDDMATPRFAKAYAKNLSKNIKARFPNYGLDQSVVAYANFLDPHLKGIHVKQMKLMDVIKKKVNDSIAGFSVEAEAMVVDNNNEEAERNVEVENLTGTEKLLQKQRNPLSNVFDEGGSGEKEADREIDLYLSLPPCSREANVLRWWQEHENILPRLSIFARQMLSIPASTAASERLFSVGGLFDSLKRSRLDPETLELLTLLKTNSKVLGETAFNDESDYEEEGSESDEDAGNDQEIEEQDEDSLEHKDSEDEDESSDLSDTEESAEDDSSSEVDASGQ